MDEPEGVDAPIRYFASKRVLDFLNFGHAVPRHQCSHIQGRHTVLRSCRSQVLRVRGEGPFLFNLVFSVRSTGRPAKRWEDDLNIYVEPSKSNGDSNNLTSDMTQLTTAQDGPKWDFVWNVTLQAADSNNQHDPRLKSPRLRQSNQQRKIKQKT